jgi:predicted alpha/beta hydrolase
MEHLCADHVYVEEAVKIEGLDQVLSGTLFRPTAVPKAWVVLAGATGVPHRYYRHFARWLTAERGLAVLTFDYRDFGASSVGSLRKSKAKMSDWAIHDVAAALAWAKLQAQDADLWVIGHSVGGMFLPMVTDIHTVKRIICVASGPVHLNDHSWPFRALVLSFWYGHGPLAVLALGYLPGRMSGLGADLPPGVYWQWRRWCITRGFHENDIGTTLPIPDETITPEVRLIGITDDTSIPPMVVWRLMQSYPVAPKTQCTLRPEDHGLAAIGHIRAFSKQCSAVWPTLVA